MNSKLYKSLLTYSLLRGAWWGVRAAFRKRQPNTLFLMNELIRDKYLKVLQDQMRAPNPMFSGFKAVWEEEHGFDRSQVSQ